MVRLLRSITGLVLALPEGGGSGAQGAPDQRAHHPTRNTPPPARGRRAAQSLAPSACQGYAWASPLQVKRSNGRARLPRRSAVKAGCGSPVRSSEGPGGVSASKQAGKAQGTRPAGHCHSADDASSVRLQLTREPLASSVHRHPRCKPTVHLQTQMCEALHVCHMHVKLTHKIQDCRGSGASQVRTSWPQHRTA